MMHYMRARRGGDPASKRAAGRKPVSPAPNAEADALRARVATLQAEVTALRGQPARPPKAAQARPTAATPAASAADARAPLGIPPEIRRKLTSGEVQALELLVDGVAKRTITQHVEQLLWQRLQGVRKTFEQAAEVVERRGQKPLTNAEWRKLVSLLHTDGVTTLEQAQRRLTEAFQMLTDKALLLRQPPERHRPADTLPRTMEEWVAARDRASREQASRRAARKR
jgi:hypothetical protein